MTKELKKGSSVNSGKLTSASTFRITSDLAFSLVVALVFALELVHLLSTLLFKAIKPTPLSAFNQEYLSECDRV
jgi:hypothetical protein